MPTGLTQAERAELAPNGWSKELLTGFKAGERAALTEVYRMHAEPVALLLRHGFSFEASGTRHRFVGYGSGFELQDVLHETFRRAFEPRSRANYDGIRPYGAYVTTIARNLVLRSFRAREVLFPLEDGEHPTAATLALLDEGPNPERELHDAEVRELVTAFLATLDSDQQRLVQLRFVEGLSQRDAAEALGLGRQRIRTSEKQLRRALLIYLREHGEASLIEGVVAAVGLPALFGAELLRALDEVTR
ncbi:RNA polymerase sigma-70 factor, ECF subfamily protein [Enhygromyxa salina]|uniref:RNA polymerase sigma-70 factor, ECF subfamily protein n=1 Tax=Enhygromyxa salina TaxID=215803 RepID=A0A0C2D5V1_9BACT|nr:sigma-70 family RNA polymerase sigma factor [Enhygromyxa salina]KIG18551.1 RNA polymerase sigma-70 factor, ECF subfamily protein [Enhygromyxa salina]